MTFEHCCPVCESDCDTVTDLKRRVKAAETAVTVLAYALREARELRDFAETELERRFPAERKSAA